MFNHEELKVYFRDKIVDFKDATISVSNTGFLYGLGVFTGIRGHYNEKNDKLFIFRPDAHFERFSFSCKLFRYSGFLDNYDYNRFLSILKDLVRVNKVKHDVYFRVSNFTDENRVTPKFVQYKDSLTVFLYPLGDYVPTAGMRCMVSSWTRVPDNSIPSRAKTHGSYVNTAFAKTEALKNGYDEAIFLDSNGHVIEGSAENIFLVYGNKLVTPQISEPMLEGITRNSVMEMARDEGLSVEERVVGRSELYRADEIFLTGTGAKVSPVVEVDQYKVGKGVVGPVSKKLQDLYFQAVRGELPKYSKWVVDAYQ